MKNEKSKRSRKMKSNKETRIIKSGNEYIHKPIANFDMGRCQCLRI